MTDKSKYEIKPTGRPGRFFVFKDGNPLRSEVNNAIFEFKSVTAAEQFLANLTKDN